MQLSLSEQEKSELDYFLSPYLASEQVQSMRFYIQHGHISTYEHCLSVTRLSFLINQRLHLHARPQVLITGAMLHDFYLYDWHIKNQSHRLHGFSHPSRALENSRRYFNIPPVEANIIESHMWPLTLFHVPKSREAVIVCLADKICSTRETIEPYFS